jgi:glutamate synthase domain-containing protein 3
VELQSLDDPVEIEAVKVMVQRHTDLTDSVLARRVLAGWSGLVNKFVKVMPKDYQRMLQAIREVEASGLSGDEAVMAVFEMNKNDLARVSGN